MPLLTSSPGVQAETPRSLFPAFGVPNFRRFVAGQSISLIGSWTETVAQALLVLQLTNSAAAVGFVTAARYLPVLLLTSYAGLVVDRRDKRGVLVFSASGLALLSLLQGVLVLCGAINLAAIVAFALAFGCMSALDNPARQAFIPEMVGKPLIRNAVTLNSTAVNVGRAVGPIVAAVLIMKIGIGWCFLVNAVSFAAVLFALGTMSVPALYPVEPIKPAKGQLIEGFRYALTVPTIIGPIAMMALIGTFTYEFEVTLPLFAHGALHGGPTTYSWLIGAFGLGSVAGGLYCVVRPATGMRRLYRTAFAYAAAMAAVSVAPSLFATVLLLFVVGIASIIFITTGNATIQLAAAPEYRGRVTALWSTAFLGSTPIGASLLGLIDTLNPRLGIAAGALACLAAAAIGRHFAARAT